MAAVRKPFYGNSNSRVETYMAKTNIYQVLKMLKAQFT